MNELVVALLLAAVEVQVERCPGIEPGEVQRITDVELAWPAVTQEPIRARLTCSGATVEVQVEDPVTQKTLLRRVNLHRQAQRGQSRALAIAIAELMTASWSELLLKRPASKVESEAPMAPLEVTTRAIDALPALQPRGVLRVEGLGLARALPSSSAVSWGGAVRVLWVPRERWGVLGDHALEHGSLTLAEGELVVDAVSASASAVMLFSLAAWFEVHAGVGARFGVGRIVGRPADPRTLEGKSVTGAWGGPMTSVGIGFVVGPVLFGVTAELGYSAVGLSATVNGARAVGLDAFWSGLGVSLGWHR